ncbi:MAG: hypothetical protein ACOH13_06960 [Flavobacteriales bacterium]
MKTNTTDQRDTNTGFHPPMATDAPATRSMFVIILVLLVVGAVIAVIAYNRFNSEPKFPVPTEQVAPPLTP